MHIPGKVLRVARLGFLLELIARPNTPHFQLMAEESAVNYWEKYGNIAFDAGQKAVLTSCLLRNPDPDSNSVISCCFSFTIRRDKYNMYVFALAFFWVFCDSLAEFTLLFFFPSHPQIIDRYVLTGYRAPLFFSSGFVFLLILGDDYTDRYCWQLFACPASMSDPLVGLHEGIRQNTLCRCEFA